MRGIPVSSLVLLMLSFLCVHNVEAQSTNGTVPIAAILNDPVPLGLESYAIPDSSMTASTEYSANHGARSARSSNANQWIQMDLLDRYKIISVATQGRQDSDQWVQSYKLACSTDGTTFHTVQGISTNPGADRIFTGNSDRNTIVTNTLPVPQFCRYIRLMPVSWYGQISLRMQIFREDINECSPDPCENGGRCSDGVDSFTCACAPGYTGPTCGTDNNECSPDPCENGGRCSDGVDSFTCACAPGYTGPTCGTDINECSPDPCENGGRCSDGANTFTCACAPGYTGPTCGTDINECSPDPCENGGRCSDGVDSFTCACAPGYTGPTCGTDNNECSPDPCENGGRCSDGVDSFTCACAPGYTGPTCGTDINECSPDPCENGGRCSDGVDSFTCACAPGYTGSTCGTDNNECSPDPCENGGRCSDGVDSFTCACAPGYTGPTCGTDINECSLNPCENGGTCSDGVNIFTCACAPGYNGPTCVTDINECSPDPCENGGRCSDGVDSFTCACAPGYTGPRCGTDIDECSPNPCENGGTCSDGVNTFTCSCAPGYTGTMCGTDINECSPDPCENGGTCSDGMNTFTCACAPGYTGPTCLTDINDCSPDPCENGGRCSDGVNTFTCACAPGYTGTTCGTDINDCSPDPCENGGTCIDGVDTFTCACAPGYIGPMCRTAARVTCDSSSMTVFISKTLNILPADLHFIDESCVGYNHNGENIALYSRYDKCKFTTEENSDFIIYSNVISTTVTDNTPNGSVITRVMGETLINVRCQIRRRQVLSRFYNPISSSLKIDEVGYGNFTVDFERYTDENFRERHPNEAAPVRIQDRLFYAVSLTSVSNLTLFIDHCWSTPSSDPLDTKQYDLIKDGCASDDTVQTISTFGPSFKPFTFDAFTFIGDYSQVYVHCEVVACNEGDTNSICAQGCHAPALPLPARLRRSVVGKPVGTYSQPRIVSQIVGPFVKGSEKQGVTAKTGWASPYILLASLAAGACLFIGMIAMYAVMKARM
ncbi:fibropellin-1 isoform X11 [Strongylocentrotus purpuratus]|uniref:Uromodulin n=1 Tax=Strongylocentrotus purpuratus TaxID=7668 RepID=A0A7M7PE93_STRPU|nr:fibropellin-1 isoform X11 [Strongylocentrotus purpuratus]